MAIKKWIAENLTNAEISQRELADRVGLDPGALSRTIAGRRRLQLDEASKIAQSFKVDLSEVLEHFGLQEGGKQGRDAPLKYTLSGRSEAALYKGDEHLPLPFGMSATSCAQWRDPSSPYDGWVFYLRAKSPILVGHLAIVLLDDGQHLIGTPERGYSPNQYVVHKLTGGSEVTELLHMEQISMISPP